MRVKEQGALKVVEGKSVWFSRLIGAGLGSSAYYPSEALAESGAKAFPVGTHIHADHQTWREWDENPANSVKTIIGIIASEPIFLRAGDSVVIDEEAYVADRDGLYAKTEYLEEWAPFIEQIHEFVGLSINAQVSVTDEPHESGLPVLEAFLPSPINTVDVVTVPGAEGRILQVLEDGIIQIDDENLREDQGMTPEEIKAVAEALSEAIVPALKEAISPVEEENEVSVADVAEAIVAADLPEAARKKVYEAVDAGTLLSEAIDAEKLYIEGITESIKAESGVLHKSNTSEPKDYTIAGW